MNQPINQTPKGTGDMTRIGIVIPPETLAALYRYADQADLVIQDAAAMACVIGAKSLDRGLR